jgi:hypothetical protein
MSLGKCAICLDTAIMAASSAEPAVAGRVPDAVVLATVVQTFPMPGGQQMAAPVLMPVCMACRQQQLGRVSKTGLVTA